MFPRKAVGSAIGIGGTVGALGGMFVATAAGFILEFTGSYYSLFLIAGSMYLIALAIIHILVPNLEPAEI
jgi:ACS family hexuronate transporter-like MFS transporter